MPPTSLSHGYLLSVLCIREAVSVLHIHSSVLFLDSPRMVSRRGCHFKCDQGRPSGGLWTKTRRERGSGPQDHLGEGAGRMRSYQTWTPWLRSTFPVPPAQHEASGPHKGSKRDVEDAVFWVGKCRQWKTLWDVALLPVRWRAGGLNTGTTGLAVLKDPFAHRCHHSAAGECGQGRAGGTCLQHFTWETKASLDHSGRRGSCEKKVRCG